MPNINMQHFGELQRNQHSIDVEIDASQIASPQRDFPMMLETPNSSNSALNVVAINELGEQLPTEIEGIANDKNWVHLKDLVQSVVNRKMKIFYGGCIGKPAANSTYGSEAVWGAAEAVYLMNDDPNSGGVVYDSTDNDIDTISHGSMTSADLVNVIYGKGINFDGSDDYLDTSDITFLNGASAFTITVAGNFTTGVYQGLIAKNNYQTNQRQFTLDLDISNKLTTYLSTAGTDYPQTTITSTLTSGEHIITISWDKDSNSGLVTIYVDGVEITNYDVREALVNTLFSSSEPFRIGRKGSATYPRYTPSTLSYISVFSTKRTTNYISTIHKNLNNPTATGTVPFYKSMSKEFNFAESLQSLGGAG